MDQTWTYSITFLLTFDNLNCRLSYVSVQCYCMVAPLMHVFCHVAYRYAVAVGSHRVMQKRRNLSVKECPTLLNID